MYSVNSGIVHGDSFRKVIIAEGDIIGIDVGVVKMDTMVMRL
jgi:methionine aminopeptidase